MDTRKQGCNGCRYLSIALSLAIGIITLWLYLPTAGFDFIHLDDGVYVYHNPFVQDGLSFNRVLYALVTTEVSYWHPLTWISHMLDCELFGMDAGGHHLVNVLIHTLNSILLFLVLRKVTDCTWKSFFAAAVFAWHPLGVETVAWISERKNLLCTLFWILTIWSHWRYAKRPSAKRNLLTALFLLMAFMAKPMAVTLPFVLLLMDVWPLNRFPQPIEMHGSLGRQAGRLLLEKTTLFIITFFVCILTIYAQKNARAISDFEDLPMLPRITNAFIAYASYLGKMVWPVDLAVLYPYTGQLRLGAAVLCASGLLVVTGVVLCLWRKRPCYAVGWFWYVGTLIPMIGLLQVGKQSMADRYSYVPLIGIFIVAAWGVGDLVRNRSFLKPLAVVGCCAALCLCTVLTRFQIHYWQNSITLFTHTLRIADEHPTTHFSLACGYFDNEQFEDAEKYINEAIRVYPKYYSTTDCAKNDVLHMKLGLTLAKLKKMNQAVLEFEQILQRNPDNANAYYLLGRLYEDEKEFERALDYYRMAQALRPTSNTVLNRIAWLLATCPDSSIRNGQEAIELAGQLENAFLKKESAEYLCTLAAAYAETARYQEAVVTAEKALSAALNKKTRDDELIELISNCLEHYRQSQPYHDGSAMVE
ncbi:MAG: tetratricopeptide repeat protein [Planctomycetota bacterium]|jgi:tetratricopeptide (TPR) repeat protein